MSYENPPVDDSVNVSPHSEVGEFLRLALAGAVLFLLIGAALFYGGGWLARYLPFSVEQRLFSQLEMGRMFGELPKDTDAKAVEDYLQSLAQTLSKPMQLPAGMSVTVHYTDLPMMNAFATLGGHVYITRELYQAMPSENALAHVLAHEIAHVQHRDPISTLAGATTLGLGWALLTGDGSSLTALASELAVRGASRQAERRADETSIAALKQHYGHAGGAAEAMQQLRQAHKDAPGAELPEWLQTHPDIEGRIARLQTAATPWNPQQQPLTPLRVPAQVANTSR